MQLLTLEETKDFMIRCIASCNTVEQLGLCNEMIDTYISSRFKHYTTPHEMAAVLNELDGVLRDQRVVMAVKKYEENNHLTITA